MKSPRNTSPATEARAQRLLRAAKAFSPSPTVTFADIQGAVRAQGWSGRRLHARLLVSAVIVPGLVLVMGGVALSRGWFGWRPRPEITFISVPSGGTTRIERRGRFRLSLRGPGAIELRGNDESVRMESGNLQVENQAVAAVVEANGHQIEIAPSSTVTIDLAAQSALRINTASGSPPLIDGKAQSIEGPEIVTVPLPAVEAPAVARAPVAPISPVAGARPAPSPRPVATAHARPLPSSAEASPAATEVTLIRDSLRRLRAERNPVGAIALLDEYERRFASGLLREESVAIRIEALLAVGRSTEALRRLEAVPPSMLDRAPLLRIARGELRAQHGRCDDALTDFAALLANPIGDEIAQRAKRGRAACLQPRGSVDAAL